jgi:signal transduction histidine kinase
MRLRTQFTVTIAIFSVILVVIGASLIITSQQVNQTRAQENLANNIVQSASNLAYLSTDYVIYNQNQQLSQWQTSYASFSNYVGNLSVHTPEQKSLAQQILTTQQSMKAVFDSIVSSVGPSANANVTVSTIQVSWSRITIQSQTLISDATQLSQLLSAQADQLNLINFALIFGVIAAFSIFLVVIYVQTFRRTLKSVLDLREGAAIIGSGNLDYKLEETKKDEIGDLSHAFNQMTSNLKNVTTSKIDLEKIVAERTKQLKDSERLAAIGATAGMVGHDIRNPLQAITSDVFLAKSDIASFPESEEKKSALESMDEIEKNIDYINKIVQDLQDYARPLNPKIEESDLKLVTESLIAKSRIPKNIKVKVKVADDSRKINADSYYLNRILYNLVTNSVQAMPQGGKLTIEAHKEAKDTVISVADTGVGIPKNVQDKMFTLMFTTKSKGQGFGLPVVKRMTESLGGTVTFDSQEGEGTTFTVRFPSGAKR